MLRKKIIVFVLIFTLFFTQLNFYPYALSASSAVVMIAETNEVIFESEAHTKRPMASTTKIMTALLAVESGRLDDVVTITDKMVRTEGTSMGLRAGDKLTLSNIVRGMMLLSGNDAANAVAIYLSGSLDEFAVLMNEKAKFIGMNDTHFVTASGLDNEMHYSTAYDMALLSSYAMKNPLFREYVCNYNATVDYIKPEGSYTYRNHNRFLTMYDGACGVKTGFTKKSGRCLVTAVEKDGCLVIAVTLRAPDDWNDHIKLYDECLPKIKTECIKDRFFSTLSVCGGLKPSVNASTDGDIITHTVSGEITTRLLTEKIIYAPIEKGDILGFVGVFSDGKLIKKYPLTADENVEIKNTAHEDKGIIYKIKDLFRRFERWLITA